MLLTCHDKIKLTPQTKKVKVAFLLFSFWKFLIVLFFFNRNSHRSLLKYEGQCIAKTKMKDKLLRWLKLTSPFANEKPAYPNQLFYQLSYKSHWCHGNPNYTYNFFNINYLSFNIVLVIVLFLLVVEIITHKKQLSFKKLENISQN